MNIAEKLQKYGVSYTKQREEIFEVIGTLHHFSYDDLEKKLPNIGRASIFRTLNLFVQIGIINKIQVSNSAVLYELNQKENHHEHMLCTTCNNIIEFDDSQLHTVFNTLAKKYNFKLESHSVIFEGLCKECNI